MKKLLILIAAIVVLMGIAIAVDKQLTGEPKPFVQSPQTTVNPVEPPTVKLETAIPDQPITSTPAPSTLSDGGTTLLDTQKTDYPDGTVVSQQFTPSTFWTWNVSWSCSAVNQTTQLPSGNYQTTGPNLSVELMIVLPPSSAHPDATTYQLVNSGQTGSGSYSVTETATQTFYFRVTGNCDWHIVALDNGTPQYQVVEPCTLNELYAVNSPSNHIPASCAR